MNNPLTDRIRQVAPFVGPLIREAAVQTSLPSGKLRLEVASVREAVEVSVSARGDEILLRAASRTVRGVP